MENLDFDNDRDWDAALHHVIAFSLAVLFISTLFKAISF